MRSMKVGPDDLGGLSKLSDSVIWRSNQWPCVQDGTCAGSRGREGALLGISSTPGDPPLFLCYFHISYHPSSPPHSAEETQRTQRFWYLAPCLFLPVFSSLSQGLHCRTSVVAFLLIVLHKAGAPTHSLRLSAPLWGFRPDWAHHTNLFTMECDRFYFHGECFHKKHPKIQAQHVRPEQPVHSLSHSNLLMCFMCNSGYS